MAVTTIFLGNEKVEEVVVKSKVQASWEESWTRSTTDYDAFVAELFSSESVRHVIVHWGKITEIYAINTKDKTVSLVALRTGLLDSAKAFVGKCE